MELLQAYDSHSDDESEESLTVKSIPNYDVKTREEIQETLKLEDEEIKVKNVGKREYYVKSENEYQSEIQGFNEEEEQGLQQVQGGGDRVSVQRKKRKLLKIRNFVPNRVIASLNVNECESRSRNQPIQIRNVVWREDGQHLAFGVEKRLYICKYDIQKKYLQKQPLVIPCHSNGIRDVKWRNLNQILSASFDSSVALSDVSTLQCIQKFEHDEPVSCIASSPLHPNIFLSGTERSGIYCWDYRSNKIIMNYKDSFGQVQDIDFFKDGKNFVSSAEIVRRNALDKGILVWDISIGRVVCNQIMVEPFTCPAVRVHPFDPSFVVQSSSDSISTFSTNLPFKINKTKKFVGHKVAGYRISCNFSPDGTILATGSSDGTTHFFDWNNCKKLKVIKSHSLQCLSLEYHPFLSTTIATCGSDGIITIWE